MCWKKKKSERIGLIRNRQVLKESHQERTSAPVVTNHIYHIDYHSEGEKFQVKPWGIDLAD